MHFWINTHNLENKQQREQQHLKELVNTLHWKAGGQAQIFSVELTQGSSGTKFAFSVGFQISNLAGLEQWNPLGLSLGKNIGDNNLRAVV